MDENLNNTNPQNGVSPQEPFNEFKNAPAPDFGNSSAPFGQPTMPQNYQTPPYTPVNQPVVPLYMANGQSAPYNAPYNYNNAYNMQPIPQQNFYIPPQPYTNSPSGVSIAALVLGIVSIILSCCSYAIGIPLAIAGLILGIVGCKKPGGHGMAITGIVTSSVTLAFCIVLIILSITISLPTLFSSYL